MIIENVYITNNANYEVRYNLLDALTNMSGSESIELQTKGIALTSLLSYVATSGNSTGSIYSYIDQIIDQREGLQSLLDHNNSKDGTVKGTVYGGCNNSGTVGGTSTINI